MFVGWAVSGILYLRLRHVSARPQTQKSTSFTDILPRAKRIFPILGALMLARVFMIVSLTTFLPIFMKDVLEATLWLQAASLTILEGAGVVGALATGTLSDRFGRFRVLYFLVIAAPLILFAFLYGPTWLAMPLLILLGLTAISPTPVLLAIVQDNFADSRALANGIFLATNFLIRAFGIWAVGFMGDQFGLQTAFMVSGGMALLTIPAVFGLSQIIGRKQ
jgi:FSR family fosmidomycin resistance protein-like MFS transporter